MGLGGVEDFKLTDVGCRDDVSKLMTELVSSRYLAS